MTNEELQAKMEAEHAMPCPLCGSLIKFLNDDFLDKARSEDDLSKILMCYKCGRYALPGIKIIISLRMLKAIEKVAENVGTILVDEIQEVSRN